MTSRSGTNQGAGIIQPRSGGRIALGHNDLAGIAISAVALLKAAADGSRQVGMNPGDEFRGGGHPLQKLPQGGPFLGGQRRGDVVLEGAAPGIQVG